MQLDINHHKATLLNFPKQNLKATRELYIRNFHLCLDVERRYALKNGTLNKFNKKWGAFTRDSNL